MFSGRFRIALAVMSVGIIGCSESPTEPGTAPVVDHMVNAAEEWSFVALGEQVTSVTVVDPAAETDWDLGFFMTGVRVNGGAGGPGDVGTYCICQNAAATDEEVMAMTAAGELPDFEAVTAADIPSDPSAWTTGSTGTGGAFDVHKWYRYNLANQHQIWPTFQVYLLKRGSAVYKVQLTSYYGPGGQARQISFRYSQLAG